MADPSTQLTQAIANTLSPVASQRRSAETFLNQQAAATPEFPFLLLQLVTADTVPAHVRQAAAVFLKNTTVKTYVTEDAPTTHLQSYQRVKPAILDMMLATPTPIRRQLSEVLAIIADHDYPDRWPNLVPSLTEKLAAILNAVNSASTATKPIMSVNWTQITAILETLHAVFDRYPERMRSDQLFTEINYSLKHSQEHVMYLFQLFTKILDDDLPSQDPKVIQSFLTAADVLIRIFYCLSWQDFPAFFEDNITTFMTELRKFLVFSNDLIDRLADDEAGPLDVVHADVLEVANIYATKYDEEFRPFLQHYITDAWALLMRRGNAPRFDTVVTTGIKFLSTVARSPDYHLFKDPSALSGVCNRIVLPNIEIRDEDIEMFEDDPKLYVRHDLEGSDTGTRRRSAVELVKALCVHFEKEVTEVYSSYVQSIFSPQTDWRKRDTAIYLVIALGWKSGTLMRGVTETSSIIDIAQFSTSLVLPQLAASAKSEQLESPIFTADLIKFVIAFRHQLSVEGCAEALAVCAQLLGAEQAVVRTYSAACIERCLTMRIDAANGKNGSAKRVIYRIGKDRVVPLLPVILPKVVRALKESSGGPDEYMMRLNLRLCAVCRESMRPHLETVLSALVELFIAATANPAFPMFNHYLFESLAALIRFNANRETIGAFESVLMGPLYDVLKNDITEFGPYVFQILSQMMSVHEGNLPEQYVNVLIPTLNPAMWERRAYVAGMVLYIETYVRRAKERLIADRQLEATLGVFQKLIASKGTDHYGLQLLSTIFESYDLGTLGNYVTAIFRALLMRLSQAKTAKYVSHLLSCLSIFVVKHGVDAMRRALDGVENGVLAMLMRQVWLPDVVKIRQGYQRKLCSIALTEVACGSELCTEEQYMGLWADMVTANVALVEGIVVDEEAESGDLGGVDEDEDEDVAVLLGAAETYSASVSQLKWGLIPLGRGLGLVENMDAKSLLFKKVSGFVEKHKIGFQALFEGKVDPQARQAFISYGGQVVS